MATEQVFIIASPRSGAGLLQEILSLDDGFTEGESQFDSIIEMVKEELGLSDFSSHRVSSLGLSDSQMEKVIEKLVSYFSSESGVLVKYDSDFGLNVDILARAFPKAKFIYVSREFSSAIASGIVAWQSADFVTEPNLSNWWGTKWSFPLVSRWKDLIGEPINEIVARQFLEITETILSDLEKLDPASFVTVSFEDILRDPVATFESVLGKIGISFKASVSSPLAFSSASRSRGADLEAAGIRDLARSGIEANAEGFERIASKLLALGIENQVKVQVVDSTNQDKKPKAIRKLSEGTAFVAHFSGALPELLNKASASIVFSAYNSGLVGTVRAEGQSIDTSYIRLAKPMGMAHSDGKLAISTLDSIKGYQRQNQLTSGLAEGINADAIFVPQNEIFTGNIAVHDMAYGTAPGYEGLWFINSAFSCLSVMNPDYSFVPKWRPKWVSSLAFENRCHLNGLAMVQGAPKYVTSLSQADTLSGWRADKGTTGVIVDITTNRVVVSGLSMPHSPRWHKNKLYFLESGKGSLASVDHRSGEVTTIATLPGFTRGLSFIGDYALVGLSQVRETAFKDLPVTSTSEERYCGIWVVDTRSGKTVGTLKFDGVIQELFEIVVIENSRWPIFIDRVAESATAFVLPKSALKDLSSSRQPKE